jgi:hypothetical protein
MLHRHIQCVATGSCMSLLHGGLQVREPAHLVRWDAVAAFIAALRRSRSS